MSKPETELSQGTEVGSQKYYDLMPGTMLDPAHAKANNRRGEPQTSSPNKEIEMMGTETMGA